MPLYSVPVLNRCVPRPVKELVFSVLNSWDTVEQVLGDLYATWREILGLTLLAFGKLLLIILYALPCQCIRCVECESCTEKSLTFK
jgi:solute carrier family 44 protein 1 (choline transporter-like protein)